MAVILAVILVPIMFYLLFTNTKKARDKRHQRTDSIKTEAGSSVVPASVLEIIEQTKLQAESKENGRPEIDPDVLKKQRKTAALAPKRNPFEAPVHRRKHSGSRKTAYVRRQPSMKVTAIMSHSVPSRRMVIINGKMLRQGSRIYGWTIVRINSDNVVLDNGTRKMTVSLR